MGKTVCQELRTHSRVGLTVASLKRHRDPSRLHKQQKTGLRLTSSALLRFRMSLHDSRLPQLCLLTMGLLRQ